MFAVLQNALTGLNFREYNTNIQRFFLFAIPLFSGLALFSLLYNLYLLRLSYQEDFIGQLSGMFPLSSGLFAVPTGILSDRIGRRPFLIGTALVMGLAQLGLCFFTHDAALLACAFFGGIAGAFVFVNFIPFLAENAAPERRGQAIAIWMSIQVLTRMVVSLGGGALPGAVGYLTGMSTDLPEPFRYALLLGAACSLVSIFPLFGIRPQSPKSKDSSPAEPTETSPTAWKHLATFTSISGFRGLAMGLSLPFFNVFFQEELHTSVATIGTVFFLSQGLGLPSTMAAPALSRRFGATLTIVPVRLFGALAIGLMGWLVSFPLAVLFFLIIAMTEALTVPAEMAFATNTLSRPYWGRMQSGRVTGFQILSALGSVWAGELILSYGYWIPFGLACLARIGSALLFLAVFGYQKPVPEDV